ncbi:ATP-grasp domain-containing protein [Pseudomonas poae]|uniref:ATP-grasp domain-containing protein n=1 Tax=Pseudomonas poae TaxID=200451 RepID=UPI0011B0CD39|nr:ATP-grasp domain-containing protein [Pseudomonas poae]
MSSCLIVNPVSNANILVRYLKGKGVDCYAIIELDKVAQIPMLSSKKKGEFQADLYKGIFTCEEQLPPFDSCLFDAILPGSENGVFLAEKLAAKYSLVGNNPATSFLRRHKDEMQHSLANSGLRFIPTTVVKCKSDAMLVLEHWDHYPCIFKPQSSAGGEGVRRCDNGNELKYAINNASWGEFSATWTTNDNFLIQPMIPGSEYVVDLVAYAGTYFISAVCRYVRGDELNIDHCDFVKKFTLMLPLDSPVSVVLADYAKRAAKALDITYGAVHMELVMGEDGPVMIEAAARIHGTITPKLFIDSYTPSLLGQLYDVYFGDAAELKDAVLVSPAVVSDVVCVKSGVYESSDAQMAEELKGLKSLRGYSCLINLGDEYVVTRDLFSSPMNACFCDLDTDQLWADVSTFDKVAEQLMGGVGFSAVNWLSIRSIYEAYLKPI